ncbi:MAG: ATP-binding protein [Endomicrobiia bacterium]|nr:ATP-binding protein [Endomicrobiia bacterium]
MRRDIEKELVSWKSQKERYPLVIRGARQVGKSYLVEAFGKEHFSNCVTVDFEFQPQLKECFRNLDPVEIVNKLQLMLGTRIDKNGTLLFLDEAQECPQALMSLRYFKEKMPELAVIAAGSLLEFALKKPDFKMPVGRVHFLFLGPLSFGEYLDASGNQELRRFLSEVKAPEATDNAIHEKLLELLRTYLIVGGMPAVLKDYLAAKDMMNTQRMQTAILQAYRSDFGKYAGISRYQYLEKVFDAAHRMVGQRIKYSGIDPDSRSRDLKEALNLLALAGIVKPVYSTSASGLPLGAQMNERKFKLNFLDIGLMQNACGIEGRLSVERDLMQINAGAVAEQFVGQELTAYSDCRRGSGLYFWARDRKNSAAEVDYVIAVGADILPVEVKSGREGNLRSMRMFMGEKKSKIGIRVSQGNLTFHDKILSLPLYMIEQLPRLAGSVM